MSRKLWHAVGGHQFVIDDWLKTPKKIEGIFVLDDLDFNDLSRE